MTDFSKVGEECWRIHTAHPVAPETDAGKAFALLKYGAKPTPPRVPTVEAVKEWGCWWWLDSAVVRVEHGGGCGLRFSWVGSDDSCSVALETEWQGPVVERSGEG